jgi:hypothetical protein
MNNMTDKAYDKADNVDKCIINRMPVIDIGDAKVNNNDNDNNYNFECREMSILIKHLENNWTIKKNVNYHDKNLCKNEKEKEYILKKNTGRDVRVKLIKLKKYLKRDEGNTGELSNEKCENIHKMNMKFTDSCLRNFIYNALENEWKLKKTGNKYFCSKRHKGDKRVYEAGYLKEFLLDNFTF